MNVPPNRRNFLQSVGGGMLLAGVGPTVAGELGLASVEPNENSKRLTFGSMEPLAAMMEETPLKKLQPLLVEKIRNGVPLKQLVAGAALANARACGGEDYSAFHAMMALVPAYEMSRELPAPRKPLSILKVLYRNTKFVQQFAEQNDDVLRPVEPADVAPGSDLGVRFKEAVQSGDMEEAEELFAAVRSGPLDAVYNQLVTVVEDHLNVHRIVLTHRSWALKDFVGDELAETLLRQSVHFCVDREQRRISRGEPELPTSVILPKLFDEYRLLSRPLGHRRADDAWVDEKCNEIRSCDQRQAAEIAAAALAEGYSPEAVGEAISLAANQRVLRDPGRRKAQPGKPVGSVHGASEGVHASDAVNAWRNVARVSNQRNAVASLIVAAYYTADSSFYSTGDGPMIGQAVPLQQHLEGVSATEPEQLLNELRSAIRANDQFRSCAITHRYGELGHPPRPMFDLLLGFAVSSDGALHAEKYYRTVSEEFATTRASLRWRHLVGLARVTASQYGFPAEGHDEACELLQLT